MRRVVIVVVVTVLVLVGGGVAAVFGGRAYLLKHQRNDYAAGHAAYLRADCAAARPRLTDAQAGRFRDRLDGRVSTAAARDQKACEAYVATQQRVIDEPLERAMAIWYAYTKGQEADPLILAGRAKVRALAREDIEKETVSAKFCTDTSDLIGDQIVRIVPDDKLAAPFLAACGRRFNKLKKWRDAYFSLGRLQGEFRKTAAARGTIDDLARASRGIAATTPTIHIPVVGLKTGTDRSLKGGVRIRVVNMAPEPMNIVTSGRSPAFAPVPPCRACSYSRHPNAASDCRQTKNWGRASLVVPARTVATGKSVPLQAWYLDVAGPYEPGLGFSGRPRLEPNGVYVVCTWRFEPPGSSAQPDEPSEPDEPIRTV